MSRFPIFFPIRLDSRLPLPGIDLNSGLSPKNGEIHLAHFFLLYQDQEERREIRAVSQITVVDITEYERLKATIQQDNERRRGIIQHGATRAPDAAPADHGLSLPPDTGPQDLRGHG